ncbi:transposase [Spirosoma sp. KCTC 42546]|uniref:transposase n=1 Tax=Spirosoma sp. KCTC 42546 TaxID=2520506 RepID=UPI00352FD0F2
MVANGESILSVARKMGISDSIIHAWRAAEKKNKGEGKQPSVLEDEVDSLRRQLRQTGMERDI